MEGDEDVCVKIHRMIMAEGATLYHVGDQTFVVPVYGYGIAELKDERIRREAAAKFMREIASEGLRELLKVNRKAFADYCKSNRIRSVRNRFLERPVLQPPETR